MDLFDGLKEKISGKNIKVVFPEGNDARIIGAAVRLAADGLLIPVVLGNKDEVAKLGADNGFMTDRLEIIDPELYEEKEAMIRQQDELRFNMQLLESEAVLWMKN